MLTHPDDTPPVGARPRAPLPAPDQLLAAEIAVRALNDFHARPTRNVVLYLRGTDHALGVPPHVLKAAREAFGEDVIVIDVEYPASYRMLDSVATGLEAVRQVVSAVQQIHGLSVGGARPQIYLIGESQGAWIAGEFMAGPNHALVKRAALLGHPGVAQHHFHDLASENVVEFNHRGDPITQHLHGNVDSFLQGLTKMFGGHPVRGLLQMIPTALRNLPHGVEFLYEWLRLKAVGPVLAHDEHVYDDHYDEAMNFLAHGVPTVQALTGAAYVAQPPPSRAAGALDGIVAALNAR